MKNKIIGSLLFGLLFCLGTGRAPAAGASPETETGKAESFIEAFYVAYCGYVALSAKEREKEADPTPALLERCLDKQFAKKLERSRQTLDYDPIYRAQDFNKKSIGSIEATHIDGDWYAVAYVDTYDGKCVVIPVRVAGSGENYRIVDIPLL